MKSLFKRLAFALPAAVFGIWCLGYSPEAIFRWINVLDAEFSLISDENDSTGCSTSVNILTCSGKTFSPIDVGKTVILSYAGVNGNSFVGTIAAYNSVHAVTLNATPTNSLPLTHINNWGKTPISVGSGYLVGDNLALNCSAGCVQEPSANAQSTAFVSSTQVVTISSVAASGSGGGAGASCTLTGTTGKALAGQFFQVSVTLNGSGNMGAGSTVGSITRAGIYTSNLSDQTHEPVVASGSSNCTSLTGVQLSVLSGVYEAKVNIGTGMYKSLICSNATGVTGGTGTGYTIKCNTITAAARWGTDNTAGFQKVETVSATQSAATFPQCIYIPAGKYLTKPPNTPIVGYGCVLGDGQFHSTVFMIPNTAGDFIEAEDCGNNGALQGQGGTFTYSDDIHPNMAGGHYGHFTIIGDLSSSAIQNGIMFSGRCQWVTVDDYQTYSLRGRSLGVEADTSGAGSILESVFSNTRFENGGVPGTYGGMGTNGVPMADFASVGAVTAPNGNHIYAMRVYHPFGPGIVFRSCSAPGGNPDIAHLNSLITSHMEASGMDLTSGTGSLLQLGDNNCTGETFPKIDGTTVAGTANSAISGFQGADLTLTNPELNEAGIRIEGTQTPVNASSNSDINIQGSFGSTGEALGKCVQIDAGQSIALEFIKMGCQDYEIQVVSYPNASQIGSEIFFNGLAIGSEFGIATNIEAGEQSTGTNPVSYHAYVTNPLHAIPPIWSQTQVITNAGAIAGFSMVGTGIGDLSPPALLSNYAAVATGFKIHADGQYTTAVTSPGSLTWNMKLAGQSLGTITVSDEVVNSTLPWSMDLICNFYTVGVNSNLYCWGTVSYVGAIGANSARKVVALTPAAYPITGIDTTSTPNFGFTTTWVTFAGADSISVYNFIIDRIG